MSDTTWNSTKTYRYWPQLISLPHKNERNQTEWGRIFYIESPSSNIQFQFTGILNNHTGNYRRYELPASVVQTIQRYHKSLRWEYLPLADKTQCKLLRLNKNPESFIHIKLPVDNVTIDDSNNTNNIELNVNSNTPLTKKRKFPPIVQPTRTNGKGEPITPKAVINNQKIYIITDYSDESSDAAKQRTNINNNANSNSSDTDLAPIFQASKLDVVQHYQNPNTIKRIKTVRSPLLLEPIVYSIDEPRTVWKFNRPNWTKLQPLQQILRSTLDNIVLKRQGCQSHYYVKTSNAEYIKRLRGIELHEKDSVTHFINVKVSLPHFRKKVYDFYKNIKNVDWIPLTANTHDEYLFICRNAMPRDVLDVITTRFNYELRPDQYM